MSDCDVLKVGDDQGTFNYLMSLLNMRYKKQSTNTFYLLILWIIFFVFWRQMKLLFFFLTILFSNRKRQLRKKKLHFSSVNIWKIKNLKSVVPLKKTIYFSKLVSHFKIVYILIEYLNNLKTKTINLKTGGIQNNNTKNSSPYAVWFLVGENED